MTKSEARRAPKAYAIALSKAWGNRFPVDVRQIALEVSAKQADPIAKIQSLPFPLEAFEGALLRKGRGTRWGIVYSALIREPGKVNFVIAHELGHYLLHREQEGQSLCDEDDMRDFARASAIASNIEQEANEFASYLLMPIGDFRDRVNGSPIDVTLISDCAEHYGTSLTATVLKLIEFIDRPVVAILSRRGVICWASSSEAAFKRGYWLTRGSQVPSRSLTRRCHDSGSTMNTPQGTLLAGNVWFENVTVLESAIYQPNYGTVFTVLECREYVDATRRSEDEDELTDSFDHFRSFSR